MDGAAAMTRLSPAERRCVAAVLAAMALVVLDAGIVNLALPRLADSLGAAPARAIMVVSAYQLALVMGLLPSAHAAERWGQRRLFVAGIAVFSAGSLLCAIAPNLPILVAARFVQGLGGAAIMALGIALLRAALGAGRLGRAIAWNALTVALCAAAGPAVGALILSVASWQWLFLAGLPVAATALLAARALPEPAPTRQPIDGAGVALYALAIALLAGAAAGGSAMALLLAAAGLASAALLVRRERARHAPILPVDLLALRPFRISVMASICCFIGQSAGLVALPFYVQKGLGHGPLAAGLILTCWPLAVAATSLVAGRIAGSIGTASQCALGGTLLAAGLLLSAILPAQHALAMLVPGAMLSGIGFGLFQLANNRSLFLGAPAERSAAAGGMQGTARLAGQTCGTLIIALAFSWLPGTIAPRTGFAVGAGFAFAAALISLRGATARGGKIPAGMPDPNQMGVTS
jgi:DHA2 family multidrug resistance protein-like MFS transporter